MNWKLDLINLWRTLFNRLSFNRGIMTLIISLYITQARRLYILSGVYASGRSHTGKWNKTVVDPVRLIKLVILISKLTRLPQSLAVISCKGSISSSLKQVNVCII